MLNVLYESLFDVEQWNFFTSLAVFFFFLLVTRFNNRQNLRFEFYLGDVCILIYYSLVGSLYFILNLDH